jgi:hypothetical protein
MKQTDRPSNLYVLFRHASMGRVDPFVGSKCFIFSLPLLLFLSFDFSQTHFLNMQKFLAVEISY